MKVTTSDKGTGQSEFITIKNEKGRLSEEEIERMVREAEEFAAEDEAQRKRIEAMNSLSNFIYGVKSQLADSEGLGRLEDDDKKALLKIVKETTEWVDSEGASATLEELEERLAEAQAAIDSASGSALLEQEIQCDFAFVRPPPSGPKKGRGREGRGRSASPGRR